MGNCHKSEYFQRKKQENKDKQRHSNKQAIKKDPQSIPHKTDADFPQGLQIDANLFNQPKKVQYITESKPVNQAPYIQNKNCDQACKLISNYGNPCSHLECIPSYSPQIYEPKQTKFNKFANGHENRYQNGLE